MPEEKPKEVIVNKNNSKKRIDTYLREILLHRYSRNYIQNAIKQGKVLINGTPVSSNYRIKESDRILINVPEKIRYRAKPENIPLNIIHEDNDIIVVNKSPGMVVHPACGNYTGTLVNALLHHYPDLPEPARKSAKNPLDSSRLGIVHRLDKDTSGVIVVAKNQPALSLVSVQFAKRTVKKSYLTIVEGTPKKRKGFVDAPIGRSNFDRKKMAVSPVRGKNAITDYSVIRKIGSCCLVEAKPRTGRMHQIRIHMAHIGCPVIGDKTYWKGKLKIKIPRQMLHASSITLVHPSGEQEITFTAPLPEDFKTVMKTLGKDGQKEK